MFLKDFVREQALKAIDEGKEGDVFGSDDEDEVVLQANQFRILKNIAKSRISRRGTKPPQKRIPLCNRKSR